MNTPKETSSLETTLDKMSISHDLGDSSGRSGSSGALQSLIDHDTIDQNLLSQQSWIRSAGQTHYRLKGLYLDSENYRTLFQSFDKESEAKWFAGQVLHTLSFSPVCLSGEGALQMLEQTWAGNTKPSTHNKTQSSPILARLHVSYYISAQWEVVKELNYLAVSRDLLDFLFEYSIISKDLTGLSGVKVMAHTSDISALCERLMRRSVQLDLYSAIERDTISVKMDRIIGMLYCANGADDAKEERRVEARSIPDIVDSVYQMVKIGRREITDSFIRVSNITIERPLLTRSSTELDTAIVIAHDSDTPDLCMFLIYNIHGPIGMSEMSHSFAKGIRYRRSVERVKLGPQSYPMWKEKIDRVFTTAHSEALPLENVDHDRQQCPLCEIMGIVLYTK